MIDVDGVSFHRSAMEQAVLKDVCFQLEPGERVALLGGNGSGKSTLVRLLNGTLQPDAGGVKMEG